MYINVPANCTYTSHTPKRASLRNHKLRDFLTPKMKGKAYSVLNHKPRKQRMPVTWNYPEKQRVTYRDLQKDRHLRAHGPRTLRSAYRPLYDRYKKRQRQLRNLRVGWWDLTAFKYPWTVKANSATPANSEHDIYSTPMPKPHMPPVYPTGPLNLNDDGTSLTYKTSHQGPNAAQWEQADSEEMERLLTSGTLRPIMYSNTLPDREATYVNPVCVEKLKDDGAL
jgi:hypothetical protein